MIGDIVFTLQLDEMGQLIVKYRFHWLDGVNKLRPRFIAPKRSSGLTREEMSSHLALFIFLLRQSGKFVMEFWCQSANKRREANPNLRYAKSCLSRPVLETVAETGIPDRR